jgi:hypothetical protein
VQLQLVFVSRFLVGKDAFVDSMKVVELVGRFESVGVVE